MLPDTHPLHQLWQRISGLATAAFLRELEEVEAYLIKNIADQKPAARIVLALPEVYRDGKLMPLQLKNTEVSKFRILVKDADGAVVPAPASDVFTVTSADTTGSCAFTIDKMLDGAPAVMMQPLKRTATGIPYEVKDSAGLTVDDDTVDIVTDLTAKAVGLDLAAPEITAQPEPAA